MTTTTDTQIAPPIGLMLLPEYRNVTVKPRARDYLIDGNRYRRVSTMLGIINKPLLIPWAKRITLERVDEILRNTDVQEGLREIFLRPNSTDIEDEYRKWVDRVIAAGKAASDEVRDKAADRGKSIHEQVEDLLGSAPVRYEPRPEARHALRFIRQHQITIEALETTVWNDEWEIAGTFDGVGRLPDGRRIIWDWKTGSGPWWEMALQLGAYGHMLERLTGEEVAAAHIVKLHPDDYEEFPVLDFADAKVAFYDAARLKRQGDRTWFPKSERSYH